MKTEEFLDFMSKVRVYDLTQPLSIHTPPWPSYMPLGIQYFKRLAGAHMGQGANGQIITTSNHVGTHMDGAIHFHASGRTIGQVPLEEWVGPGVVVDISDQVEDYDLYSPEMITEKVEIKSYNVIYECLSKIDDAMKGLLEPERIERILGRAEVRKVF